MGLLLWSQPIEPLRWGDQQQGSHTKHHTLDVEALHGTLESACQHLHGTLGSVCQHFEDLQNKGRCSARVFHRYISLYAARNLFNSPSPANHEHGYLNSHTAQSHSKADLIHAFIWFHTMKDSGEACELLSSRHLLDDLVCPIPTHHKNMYYGML
jgi:hypothetical protein